MLIISKENYQLIKDTFSLEGELSTYCQQTQQECHVLRASTGSMEETIRCSKEISNTVKEVIVDQGKITKGEDVTDWYAKQLKNSGTSLEITRITLEENYTSECSCISLPILLKDMEQRRIINNRFLNSCLEKLKKIKNHECGSRKKY